MLDQASNLRRLMKNKNSEGKEKKAKVITITSGKGGVGKSNVVINLAIALEQRGKKVLIFDADIGMGNDDILLGIFPKYNIYDILLKDMTIEEVIMEGPLGVKLLSGGSGINKIDELSKEQREVFLGKLMSLEDYDYILLDTGAGISRTVMAFIAACDELIVVTTPEPTSITDAYSLLKASKSLNTKSNSKVVINKCFTEEEGMNTFNKFKMAGKKFLGLDIELLGIILDDKKLEEAVREQVPLLLKYPNTKSAMGIYTLANSILGIENEGKKGMNHFFKKLFDIFSQGEG